MKKLIVSAAVALMATFANAASANWTFYSDDPAMAGLDVYIVSAVSEFEGVSDISANLVGTAGNSGKMELDAYGGATALGTVSGLDNALDGQDVSFYYVIVSSDGKGYWASPATTAEIYTTATSPVESEVDGTALLGGSYTAWKTGGGSGGGGSGGVPEPTSGLLLLVGGAMLALRRKQK